MSNLPDNPLTYKINNHIKPHRFGKGEFTTQLLTRDFATNFKLKHPQYRSKKDHEILADWQKIAFAITDIVLNEPDGIKIGNNMGEFKLGLLRVHNIIDRYQSSLEGKPIKFMNYETNRKPGKFVWKTEYARIVHFFLRYLAFKPCRAVQAKCFQNMKEQGDIYKDVTDKHKFIK